MVIRRRCQSQIIWFGGVGLVDAILGVGGDQTVRRAEISERQCPEEGLSDSDSEKKSIPDSEKQ